MGNLSAKKKNVQDEKKDLETGKNIKAENKHSKEDAKTNTEEKDEKNKQANFEDYENKIRESAKAKRKEVKETSTGTAAQVEPNYFSDHNCSWKAQHFARYQIKCGAFRKLHMYWTCPRSRDCRARYLYRSYADLFAEVRRQFESHPFTIHPFSRLRLGIQIFVLLNYHVCLLCIVLYITKMEYDPYYQYSIMATEFSYIIFTISNFFTGFLIGVTDRHVVMNLRKVAYRYVTTWFVVDALYPFGMFIFTYNLALSESLRVAIVIFSLKLLRLPAILSFSTDVMNGLGASERLKTYMHIIMVMYNYLLWNVFFQYSVEYAIENTVTPTDPRFCSWISVTSLWNETATKRRAYSLERAVGMLRRHSNLRIVSTKGACVETFYIIFWIIGWFACIHCAVKYMILMVGEESAKAKFVTMCQQVKTYMNHRRYPDRIKQKVLKFYVARFHSIYCSENKMLSCMSGQLREDIIMHISRQLVSEVEFLKKLPRNLLLSIGTRLKIVVFLAGDIIYKINTVADCLYFIDKGTVAMYTESGMEFCHLQDGDYFGATMVLSPRFRIATVVAITNCELFRLDKKDFDATIACFPTIFEDIKKVALSRRERLRVCDDHHKAEWNAMSENRQEF